MSVKTSISTMVGVDDVATKLTHSGWLRIEKSHNPFTMSVLTSLSAFGRGEESKVYYNQDRSLQAVGQKLYISDMRPAIEKILKLFPANTVEIEDDSSKKKEKGGKKKGGAASNMSKDDIIQTKIANDIQKFLPNVVKAAYDIPKAREHLAELRMVQFLLYTNHVIGLLMKDPNSHVGYEALISMHNAMASAKNVKNLAQQVLTDAQEMKDRLEKVVRFSYEELLTVYPRLVFNNLYSELYHEAVIKPYKDQQRLIDSLDTKCSLTFYNTVPGSGKTTAVVGVVTKIMKQQAPKAINADVAVAEEKKELNMGRSHKERKRNIAKKSQKGQGRRVVVFVCTNMLVREQVGRDAYNIDIPFAVAANMTYREHFNAKTRDVSLVISDLETAVSMLERFSNPVLFIDEPTIAAETDHIINDKIMHLILHSPRQTILSSATLPRPKELQTVIDAVKQRHQNLEVIEITSNRIGIGCHAIHEGVTVFPFEGCTTVEGLERALDVLLHNPFMFRLLSIEVVVTLRNRMGDIKQTVPDWATIFPDPSQISHQMIADHAITLLTNLLSLKDNAKISRVCQPLDRAKYRPFKLETLLTEDAHQHMQGALYATADPVGAALKLSELFIKELPNVENLLKDYNKRKEAFDKEKQRIEKSIKNEEKKSQTLQALTEPRFELPTKYIPNTLEHLKTFAPMGTKYDPQALQSPPIVSHISDDFNVPSEILLLLYLGIGIYSPDSKVLNPHKMEGVDTRYTEKVVEMCSAGYISFLFADRSIVYGTNFPFSNVFIDPDFAKDSSLNTLYQLIGRAGRVGKSYMAKVILIDNVLKKRLVEFSEENIEALHLCKAMARNLAEGPVQVYTDGDVEDAKEEEEKPQEEIKPAVVEAVAVKAAAPAKKVDIRAKKADEEWAAKAQAAAEKAKAAAPVEDEKVASGDDLGNWDD